jgi:hypothetical protein
MAVYLGMERDIKGHCGGEAEFRSRLRICGRRICHAIESQLLPDGMNDY